MEEKMAVERENPYPEYNFLVSLGSDDPQAVRAGFMEVCLPEIEVQVIEYRQGNERQSQSRKLPGRVTYGDLVLKRGVIGALDLYEWLVQVVNGDPNSRRNVQIQLLNEDRSEVVLTWKLRSAWPKKYQFSGLDAQGQSVVIETLTLAVESMEIE
jgi:phage tail-like protein